MRPILTHIMMLAAVALLTACVSSEGDSQEQQPTVLSIYIYAPDRPIPTRAVGAIDATDAENRIVSLQLWVFRQDNRGLVAYYEPANLTTLNSTQNDVYQVAVTDEFAATRPPVNVYVVANVTTDNCGVALDASSTQEEIEAALLPRTSSTKDYFGLVAPITQIPAAGLPMTGARRNLAVTGSRPALRVSADASSTELARVQLARIVSRVQFFFSGPTENEAVSINEVKINADMIPDREYLFLNEAHPVTHVATTAYNTSAATLLSQIGVVNTCTQPEIYAYNEGESATDYEARLQAGLSAGALTQTDAVYLRESDRRLQGTIKYRIGNASADSEVSFQMAEAGDFARNHSWVVYAYYSSMAIQVVTVDVSNWRDAASGSHEVYNW